MKLSLILCALVVPFFSQCSSPSSTAIPKLTSPARSASWGAPTSQTTANGYTLTYTNPSNSKESFKIHGSRNMFGFSYYPPDITGHKKVGDRWKKISKSQTWTQSKVANTKIYWYQTHFPYEDSAAKFRSRGEQIKSPSGSAGHFQFSGTGTKNQMQRWLSELRFAN